MSKMKSLLSVMMPLALMAENGSGQFDNNRKLSEKDIDFTPKVPPVPKGCKKYVFKESFGTLEVIAINEKSAMKKYNKWCASNSQVVV